MMRVVVKRVAGVVVAGVRVMTVIMLMMVLLGTALVPGMNEMVVTRW